MPLFNQLKLSLQIGLQPTSIYYHLPSCPLGKLWVRSIPPWFCEANGRSFSFWCVQHGCWGAVGASVPCLPPACESPFYIKSFNPLLSSSVQMRFADRWAGTSQNSNFRGSGWQRTNPPSVSLPLCSRTPLWLWEIFLSSPFIGDMVWT